jgi:hypothetical protein
MQDIDDEIHTITEAFAQDLAVLVRKAAIEAAAAALGGGGVSMAAPAQTATKRGRGRPRKAAPAKAATGKVAKTVAAPKAARAAKKAAKRAPGEKRPPAELAKLTDKLGDYIKAHPGLRMEAIGKGLGVATRDLNLPVKKLLTAKKIKTHGHKRATEYFPA